MVEHQLAGARRGRPRQDRTTRFRCAETELKAAHHVYSRVMKLFWRGALVTSLAFAAGCTVDREEGASPAPVASSHINVSAPPGSSESLVAGCPSQQASSTIADVYGPARRADAYEWARTPVDAARRLQHSLAGRQIFGESVLVRDRRERRPTFEVLRDGERIGIIEVKAFAFRTFVAVQFSACA